MNLPQRCMRHGFQFSALLLVSAGAFAPARAQVDTGQDTRLRLDQQLETQRADKEAETLEGADEAPTSLVIDGRTYSVANNANEMGRALYIAMQRRQWRDVRRFLAAYERLPDADPLLVRYASGVLARQDGKLTAAEKHLREVQAINADFIPGRLELARVLFENRKDRDAEHAFEHIRELLGAEGDKAAGVVRTVDKFLAALKRRMGWQGNIAIGPGYSTNLNQSSESYTCLLATSSGDCLFERKVPDAIKAAGINFEGSLARTIPISGHHAVRARAVAFGDIYPDHHDYSQAQLTARVGYQYQAARNSLSISPSFDVGSLGSDILYEAWGLNADWTHTASSRVMLRLEGNYRDFRYRRAGYSSQDGPLADVNLTAWYVPAPGWTLFGGPDFAAKDTADPVNSWHQWGGRFGVSKFFGNAANLFVLGSYRQRDHRAYSAVFQEQRHDQIINATAIARFPALNLAGLIPELVVQHTRVKSNIDWLYSYNRTTASVRLNYAF